MRNLAAVEIRRLHRKVAQVDRRLALAHLPGKVHPGSQDFDKRTIRLELGKTSDGKVILSPPIRWQQPGAGKLKVHAPPKDSEQMTLHSPSGTVGTGSLAVWGTFDKDNEPPSKSADEAVLEYGGKSRITLREDEILITIGSTEMKFTPDLTRLKTPKFEGVKG